MSKIVRIIEQSSDWLVVDKPAGILTIPGRDPAPSLLDWAKEAYGPVWVVHRLDRETSGVLLLARNEKFHRQACLWFQNREMKKQYFALCQGTPSLPVFRVKTPISGSPCNTQVEVLDSYQEGFFARVTPLTGRRHQIRIHLSENGFPIWGDVLYKGPEQVLTEMKITRVALHAGLLQFPSGQKFEAPLPPDMNSWLSALRNEGTRV